LFFFVMGTRAITSLSRDGWPWVIPGVIGYLSALSLPALGPGISALVWRELMAPQTRIGRAAMAVGLSLLPIAGVLGASTGLSARRLGIARPVMVIAAILALSGAIIWVFSVSHQLWPERPWGRAKVGGD
jgi:hypothetical protein